MNFLYHTLWSSVFSLAINLIWFIVLPFKYMGSPASNYILSSPQRLVDSLLFLVVTLIYSSLLNIVLILPFSKIENKHKKTFIFTICLWTQLYWIGLELIRSPTYFADTLLIRDFVRTILYFILFLGPAGYSIMFFIILCFILQSNKHKKKYYFVALFVVLIPWIKINQSDLLLQPNSQILIFSDSLRATHWNKAQMPSLHLFGVKSTSYYESKVLASSNRTTTAMTTFLTGLSPKDHQIETMFSKPYDNLKNISWLKKIDNSYCKIVIADAAGDFFNRYDYGFDYIIAPKNSWQIQLNSSLIRANPFILAWMASYQRNTISPKIIQDAVEASISYTDPKILFSRATHEIARKCYNRPVFAVLFSGATHMPYFQSWPFYKNIYQQKNPQFFFYYWLKQYDNKKQYARTLYSNSVLAFDEAASTFAIKIISLSPSTSFVISSDHAEYLYDDGHIAGHGDVIKNLDGLLSPLVIIGPLATFFQSQNNISKILSNKWYAQYILNTVPHEKYNYTETELWLTDTYRPKQSIHYPKPEELLTIDKNNDSLVIKDEWKNIVESAKHRSWFWDNQRLDYIPEKNKILFYLNSKEVTFEKIPNDLKTEIEFYKNNYRKFNTRTID